MKTIVSIILLLIGCCGCKKSNGSAPPSLAASRQEELQYSVQWPSETRVVKLAFELVGDMPVIRCKLNGKPAALYLDTAAQPICLYEDRLQRFGLKVQSRKNDPRYTAGGRIDTTPYCGEFTLMIEGGFQIQVSGAPCLPGEGRSPGHDVDGIFGVKVMKALNAVIDLDLNTITFTVKP
jgi:hypothetical protein